MEYIINNNNLKVTINSLGAEMVSVLYKNKERLWQNDNNTWTGHAPVLFPIAGNKEIKINGIVYPLKQHGLARKNEFTLDYIKEDSISLYLESSNELKELYPFDFKLTITYYLIEDSIKMVYIVENKDNKDMYYSIGGHTSFKVDNELKNYNVILENDKDVYSYNMEDKFITTKDLISNNGIVDLDTTRLDDSATIIIPNLKSTKATLENKNNEKIASIEFYNFKHFLLWHPIDSKMVCMEPWCNLPDSIEQANIEFKDKDYTITLKPNSKDEYIQLFTYFDKL